MNRLVRISLVVATFFFASTFADEATRERGRKIFQSMCADCHGDNGQGVDDYPPLFGDRSAIELAEVISTSMPEGEPDACTGEDAQAIAEWMLPTFYSPQAQARLHPPKRKLSRLTVAQHRNSLADLVAGFLWTAEPGDKQGFEGTYFKTRRTDSKDKVIERIDDRIDFDFGEATPDAEKIKDPNEFCMTWTGSIRIDETGLYEFTVETENGFELNINGENLIDARTRSGDSTTYSESIYLLAGRLYRFEMEWFTFQEKTASVSVFWKPPHSTKRLLTAENMVPVHAPRIMVVSTPIPPDDRSDGYIRGTSVSREWHDAVTAAATEFADKLPSFLPEVAKLKKEDSLDKRREKLLAFCEQLTARAFRRPLTDELKRTYVHNFFNQQISNDDALRRSVLAILTSPRFLYRDLDGPEPYRVVERLSFALHDSIPHPGLLEAADKGWVMHDESFNSYAGKLANTLRGKTRLKEFLRVWLNLERLHSSDKSAELFPEYSPELLADLRASLERSLDEAIENEDGFRRLMTGRETWMNERMAKFYGVEAELDPAIFRAVEFEKDQRAGIVSHPFLLTSLAYDQTSSPIHRGVFLSRGLLGRTLKPPPDSVSPLAPDLEPHLTTRERVLKQTSPTMCANCHRMINSLGFALEGFDAVGRFRTTEKDRPIDSSGKYRKRSGEFANFASAPELAEFLLQSEETQRSFTRQLFHHMVQQPILSYGPSQIEELTEFWQANDLKMMPLAIEIARRSARFEEPK